MKTDEQKACEIWITAIMLNKKHRHIFEDGISIVRQKLKDIAVLQIDDALDAVISRMLEKN